MKRNRMLPILCAMLILLALAGFAFAEEANENAFSLWNKEAPALTSLLDYMKAITDIDSPDYIPPEDRIAVFDLDGTLMCETDPFCFEYMVFADYALSHADTLPDDVVAVAEEIVGAAGDAKPEGMSTRQAAAAAVAYKGMTMAELAEVVERFKASDAWGFTGLTRGNAWYKPMLQLVDYLESNGFTVYIVTATERNIVRQVIDGTLDIPPSHVIGTEYGYTATNQGDAADSEYTFTSEDTIVFDGNYYGENAKTSKVDAIVREIGQQPVLAFGNSSGDLAMEIYTISANPYRSAAYMILADDEKREYGNAESAAKKKADYEAQGIGTISMRDDFLTIYGDGVAKATPQGESPDASDSPDHINVSYLGPEGTYTEEATQFWFQNGETLMPKTSVHDALLDVQSGIADYAVIPQENTLGGAVINYVDALIAATDTYVVGEVVLPISQTLMGVPGATLADIRTVCSHTQGLTQSAEWRASYLPEAETVEMSSTAAAASHVAELGDKTVAAVAAPGAAALYGLDVLATNVQITDANKTRFYVLSRRPLEADGLRRAVFVATCEGSQIDDILVVLHDAGLEIVSLHDRPEGSRLGKYHYVIEAECDTGITDAQTQAVSALDGVRFAGCFNMVEKRPEKTD
ncbi:MAG: haloacid dehalogenase-like hydrolase [Clostridia bacterium]|nr:haloacid dehalogenase-like hydrolase [Clostridia bacterium]